MNLSGCGERGLYARDSGKIRTVTQAKIDRKREVKDDFRYEEEMWMIYATTLNHMTLYEKFFPTFRQNRQSWSSISGHECCRG